MLSLLKIDHGAETHSGTITAEFDLDLSGFLHLLADLRRIEGVAVTKLQYDGFFETCELELRLEGVEDPDVVLCLLGQEVERTDG